MKEVIDTSEVLGTVDLKNANGLCEVCVSAGASYDEASGRLKVNLESFLRPAALLAKERHFRANWLPSNEVVTEAVSREECHEVARDIFRRWVRKVRESVPSVHPG
jgi:hypothetical protein